ncbi:MAG: ThuA domain-containing protein [Fibrobacteres bacterium]|nr:ThuA domain-containing protein [Fibrobacterota bacterium]
MAACIWAPSHAASGPITSNLKRALIYFYNYAGDHTNTPAWCGYIMKLGAAHGITIDTTRNPSTFTVANLSNYQAVVLFNAYYIGQSMSQTQKDALHDWYKQNLGIACIHQCVRNTWGGVAPNWYDSLMGGITSRPPVSVPAPCMSNRR